MDYKDIDLNANARKGFADISAYMEELGNLSNNMKAQQKFKLLNHQVILKGLNLLQGLNSTLDEKVKVLLRNVEKGLEQKKTPFFKVFSFHILAFIILFIGTVVVDPDIFSIGYALSSVGMGCATGVLNLMLLRERKKYEINNIFFILDEERIEDLEPLHQKLAIAIEDFNKEENEDIKKLEISLKETIKEIIK